MRQLIDYTGFRASMASVLFILFIGATGCKEKAKDSEIAEDTGLNSENMAQTDEEAQYRPNFHFTPKEHWINDPNGMFYFNEYYHLYYQYHPESSVWGPMHWGHAISTDMISWKEQPIALAPDELGYIFSGSAVVDIDNTSGFATDGKIPIVAMFTSHNPDKAKENKIDTETQSIAYSLDEGLTYTKYEGNPVIENPGIRDFRDPKVSWNAANKKWNMVLAADDKIMFYESENLKEWTLLSDFGKGIGAHGGVWECPDLFPLPVRGSDDEKWVLLVSINPGGPNGGSATQYFIGDFDGKQFTMDENFKKELQDGQDFWVDFGKDNYAGVTWSNVETKDGGKYFVGWMSNWQYANEVPTETWRGAMTIPRELQLVKTGDSYRLASEPVAQLKQYRNTKLKKDGISVNGQTKLVDSGKIDLSSAEIIFDISDIENSGFNFKLSNPNGDELSFGYNSKDKNFYVDRTKSGNIGFSEDFADKTSTAPRVSDVTSLSGKILLDKTSIELFYDNGLNVMTEIFFPNAPFETLTISSDAKELTLDHFEIHELKLN
ncbi:MAG: glycoside hydrolase family 32 protein [Pricia sp.]